MRAGGSLVHHANAKGHRRVPGRLVQSHVPQQKPQGGGGKKTSTKGK